MNDENVYLLKLPGGARLLYAPLLGRARILAANENPAASDFQGGAAEPRPKDGKFLPDFLGLIPTRGCNLDCRYCGFRSRASGQETMTREMAEGCIRWYVRLLGECGRKELRVHFFGGEPFIEPDICAAAVAAARRGAARYRLRPVFEAATNGFLPETTAIFVRDNIDFIVLSLDGPKQIQDRHRPAPAGAGSFATVCRNARLFSQGRNQLCLRACITAQTVGKMEDIAAWFAGEFHPASVSFETLQESELSRAAGLKPPDPWEFGLNFVKAERLLAKSGIECVYATADTRALRVSFCPVAGDSVIVSPDGSIAGCYLLPADWRKRSLDMVLGRLDMPGTPVICPESVARLRAMNVTNKPRCARCFCKWHCAGGCHVNHSYPGCPEEYDDLCIQTRIIALHRILESGGQRPQLDRLAQRPAALRKTILQPDDRLNPRSVG